MGILSKLSPFSAVLPLVGKVLDRVIPDKAEAARREIEAMVIRGDQDIKAVDAQLSAIMAEANSADPWTSRARPSFMYVIYLLILSAIPMGILSAFNPEMAVNITVGYKSWLAAIPSEMLALFGVGYLGYTGARTMEKKDGVAK